LAAFLAVQPASRAQTNPPPDFKEVYDLIRTHAAGASDAELNRAAVEGFLKELGAEASLVTGGPMSDAAAEGGLLSKTNLFENSIAYLRVAKVGDGLATGVSGACGRSGATNKLNGLVLDLRYADGTDYAAAVATADLFIPKPRPLLNWGSGVVSSRENTNAIRIPVAVLVNHETAGAAEALAAMLREADVAVILGSRTAGKARIAQEFPLKNGQRLRIATGQIRMGDDSVLPAQGIKPDIDVVVSAADERAYYADAFRVIRKTNPPGRDGGDRLSTTNRQEVTNGTLLRLNEAELVRERREGSNADQAVQSGRIPKPEIPVVSDPALARALDLLEGLAVVRNARS